eukprot:871285-Amphidinium_carterae.1
MPHIKAWPSFKVAVVIMFGGNLIHWKSSKQTLVTKFSCEAELPALVSGVETSEILGLYNFECLKTKNAYEASSDNTA